MVRAANPYTFHGYFSRLAVAPDGLRTAISEMMFAFEDRSPSLPISSLEPFETLMVVAPNNEQLL
ncbi:hypothetical protein CGZ80_10530 [Rhodopirellula sp. MGV]|nr:hypothetical protein CGZ80_10530 [Rhodopirellula sp. MGV]PNY36363.1 hypothetical protein C2E31_13080 [Rhodopirellula baltica]